MNEAKDKKSFILIVLTILVADLAVILDIPFVRQIIGFLFLTFIPGLLILHILDTKIEPAEKFILCLGISISFLLFFGLLINYSSLSLGYSAPLSTFSLLIAFNLMFFLLAVIGYKINKTPVLFPSNLNLTSSEKAFLIFPILFPALSILGVHVMNTTDNNIIILLLLFLIPIYVAFVCFFNHKFPTRIYPVVILLLSISLLILYPMRSSHIIGSDITAEYYTFLTTWDNLHWSVLGKDSTLDACLSISLLPSIYQSVLNINPEFLYKFLYSLLFSVFPLTIYVLSKKYVGEMYAFLASFFSMSQLFFLTIEVNPRTSLAVLFIALAMMTLFNDKMIILKKRLLVIIFLTSCVVSHYSTTYVLLFIMLGVLLGVEIISKKYPVKKIISLILVPTFFAFIFFWYSQVTGGFGCLVTSVSRTFVSLNDLFIMESRSGIVHTMLGEGITQTQIPNQIEFVFTWLTFVFIGIGVITTIIKRKEMLSLSPKFKKLLFLREKIDVTYFMFAVACSGLLVAVFVVPYIAKGYNILRMYNVTIIILALFFIIGGMVISSFLNQFQALLRGDALKREQINRVKIIPAYLIIMLVLIPYFFCNTGVTYNLCGVQRSILLDSEGEQHVVLYVYDQECYGAKWLREHSEENFVVYADYEGSKRLVAYAQIARIDLRTFTKPEDVGAKPYIYLRYPNVVDGKMRMLNGSYYNISECSIIFVGKSKIYGNGGSEIHRHV